MSNLLKDTHPEIFIQLDKKLNKGTVLEKLTTGSTKVVWWYCIKFSTHRWQATVQRKVATSDVRCPFCASKIVNEDNCLATLFPKIAKELNEEKSQIKASELSAISSVMVWWKCANGHEWFSEVRKRTNNALFTLIEKCVMQTP